MFVQKDLIENLKNSNHKQGRYSCNFTFITYPFHSPPSNSSSYHYVLGGAAAFPSLTEMMKMKEKLIFRNIFLTAERMSTVGVLVAHRTPGMVAIHLQEWMGIGGHTFHQLELQIVIALSAYLRVRGWLNQTQRSACRNI